MDLYKQDIKDVGDAVKLIESPAIRTDLFTGVDETDARTAKYVYPFGIWFRGQKSYSWKLVPNVFRDEPPSATARAVGVPYDETSLFYHFQLRVPEHRSTHSNTFDWLCLMQHYGAPTRLLDWSESLLTALFFAVEDPQLDGKEDAALFCLNARKLNALGSIGDKSTIAIPTSLDVALRAQMTLARTRDQWADRIGSLESTDIWDRASLSSVIAAFATAGSGAKARKPGGLPLRKTYEAKLRVPTAVLPSRLNGRLLQQTGAFTISGGKVNRGKVATSPLLEEPLHLDDIAAGAQGPFLLKCRIPMKSRKKIRETLRLLGIHHGSLFPELEHQARFIRQNWRPE